MKTIIGAQCRSNPPRIDAFTPKQKIWKFQSFPATLQCRFGFQILSEQKMTLEIIGAGFGRTGTESMKRALELIGFGPCYHMHEVLPDQGKVDTWRAIANGEPGDWDKIFVGYTSTVDWPGAFVWRDLATHFPDAKILLTNRSAESWFRSMDTTILEVMRSSTDPNSIAGNLLKKGVFSDNITDRDHIIEVFERNVADVQAAFDKDRLLTFNIGDGWEPLCEFLNCAVPDQPFPHSNRTAEFHDTLEDAENSRGGGGVS